MMKFIFSIVSALIAASALAQVDEIPVIQSYRKQCLEIAAYALKDYRAECHYNFHHFNPDADKFYSKTKALRRGDVRIAEFNVLHPGMLKTRYKDYNLVARIIDQWDVVAVTELLPLVSGDLKHNDALLKFVAEVPAQIENLKLDLRREEAKRRPNAKSVRSLTLAIKTLENDLERAQKLYRRPGYLKILNALRKLPKGKEWSLILSPRAEAAKPSDTQEMVGYFYRGSMVKPAVNKFCLEVKTKNFGTPFACIADMGPGFMGKDYRPAFSRRPFMADFESGNFKFTMLASHVVFNSPTEPELMEDIMKLAFGARHPSELGVGINNKNYARFAEVKLALDFMEKIRRELGVRNIIYAADTNLEASLQFWPKVLRSYSGAELFIRDFSTVSERRFRTSGTPTNGLVSDYDHFIFDPSELQNCLTPSGTLDGGVFNFYEGAIQDAIEAKYIVRREAPRGPYEVNRKKYEQLVQEFLGAYRSGEDTEETIGFKIVEEGGVSVRIKGIIEDSNLLTFYVNDFEGRVLNSQLEDSSYYAVHKQLISDHKPIYMRCSNR